MERLHWQQFCNTVVGVLGAAARLKLEVGFHELHSNFGHSKTTKV